jgi:hypothetical protein
MACRGTALIDDRIDAADVEGTGFDVLVYRLQLVQLIGQEQKEIILFMCRRGKTRLRETPWSSRLGV